MISKILIGIGVTIILLIASFTGYVLFRVHNMKHLSYPNTYIDTVYVGEKTPQEIEHMFLARETAIKNTNIRVFFRDEHVATYSAEDVNFRSSLPSAIDRVMLVGRSPRLGSLINQTISSIFGIRTYRFTTVIEYDDKPVKDFLTTMQENYNVEPENALFTFENGKVTSFQKEKNGSKVQVDKFKRKLKEALDTVSTRKVSTLLLVLEEEPVLPEITLGSINNWGIEELIGEGKSNYKGSSSERLHNIKVALGKFNGVVVEKGKTISFNSIVGDISRLSGYKPAYIIQAGRTVLGDGGGVCQVSTTLFRAGLNTGLPIEERHAHAYRVKYYENDSPPGLDATIFSPSVDLKMTNDTPAAILIMTDINEETKDVFFRLYGKKDGRRAEISEVSVYDQVAPPEAVYQDDPTLPTGTTKQVEYPAWGSKAKFDYKVMRDDEIIFGKTFLSTFKSWRAVYLVGKG